MTTPKAKFAGLVLIAALCAGVTLGLTSPAWAGYDEGVAAYNRGDYAAALREFRPLAEQGHAKAQFNLGLMYHKGHGVPRDYAKALQWYRKSAEQGYPDAQNNLGLMYKDGLGVPQDYAKAVGWYRKPAEQGNAIAQNNLGLMYDNGRGVRQDYAEAARWYLKAAWQGVADAQNILGFMYGEGQGVPQDYVQSHMWLNIAASRLPPGENRDKAVNNRKFVESKMTQAQISEAQKLAREWKPKN